jgi:hypothetical protein
MKANEAMDAHGLVTDISRVAQQDSRLLPRNKNHELRAIRSPAHGPGVLWSWGAQISRFLPRVNQACRIAIDNRNFLLSHHAHLLVG